MAFDPVAQARVDLELNDDALVAGLRRVEEQHQRTMREIDRSRAEATIDLDTSGYDDAVKNVRRELKELDGQKATGTLDMDDEAYKKKVKELKRELRDLEGQKATIELRLKGEDAFHRANKRIEQAEARRAAANEKRLDAIDKLEKARQREYEKAEARRIAGVRKEADFRARMERQRERELASAHGWALKINAEMDRAEKQREREIQSIPRLQREYAELAHKLEHLAAARRKVARDQSAAITVDFKIAEAEAKMRLLHAELERIGSPINLDVNIRPGQKFGAAVRDEFRRGGVTSAAFVFGAGLGDRMVQGLRHSFSGRAIRGAVFDTLGKLGAALGSLSEATVRIGPFTATVRQAILALSILGPTLLDLAGAAGALVGVIGTGLTGALALGAGALGSFAISLGGVGLLLPSLFRDFKNLTQLQDAYHKAVLKYGEDSDQAKDKLKEFNHALGEVNPTTRRAFMSVDKLQDRWRELNKAARPDFFNALASSIDTVNHHFEWFRRNTLEAFHSVSEGWEDWMKGLRSNEADRILRNLGDAGNKSIEPLMHALGNIGTIFGRIAESAARFIPDLVAQFDRWTGRVKDSEALTGNLDSNINRLVDHTKALGRFFQSAGRFLVSFFDAGADSGKDFLDTMSGALDRWSDFNRSVEGRRSLQEFFHNSVEGAEALYNALAPIVSSFVRWARNMAPVIQGFLDGVGYVGAFVSEILELTGLQGELSTLATTIGALWAVGRIRAAIGAITGFGKALTGLRGPAAVAAASTNVGAGTTGAAAAAGTRSAGAFRGAFVGGLKAAGWIGVALMVMDLLGNAMKTVAQRSGTQSTFTGLGRDIWAAVTFGMIDSADEASQKASREVVGALRRNINLELNKNTKLGDKGGWSRIFTDGLKDIFNDSQTTLDLTIDQKKLARNFQLALQTADRIARMHHLPDLTTTVKVKSDPADFKVIENNMNRLKNNLASSNHTIRRNTDETLQAMKRSMDLNSASGAAAVGKNMQLTVQAITRNIDRGATKADTGLREIRRQFRVHTQAAAKSADVNFGHAKTAIDHAVQEGKISSERGLREIRKLWVSYLKLYGFSPEQARNIGNDPTRRTSYIGGPEEGTRGAGRASGGLINIGTPGRPGRDSVPMNLGGVPSIVAPGEQIAVFNRHQQKALGGMVPGGLEGFFATHKRPHHMAGGGIVPVPGFPGEMANASILPEIAMVANRFGLVLTDAYGQGHASPGHTQTGTAADFAGSDRAMDAAVRALVGMGYLVGYDGRFGSQRWPGHGPSTVAGGNAHLHVEFGQGGPTGSAAVQAAQTIERQMVTQGLGAVTTLTQAAVDIVREAAQANLDAVARQSLTVAYAGGQGANVNEAQVRLWIAAGLRLAGQTASAANVDTLLGRVMQESGGNPRAINLWDSNAKAGHPSKGLLQTIDSTFDRYKVAGHDNIYNPVDNVAAAVRYMLAVYGRLVGRSGSGYAAGGIVTMPQSEWARGGKIERPTLMTGEDGRKFPEFVIGTNPAYKRNNIEALTAAANQLGIPMARKSKTGTIKPHIRNTGKDPERLRAVRNYGIWQQREEDKGREISIAESRVREPDTFIKQQGTDANGNPLFVVDQAKLNAYVATMEAVRKLYDDLINRIMSGLATSAQKAFEALDNYRNQRTANIQQLEAQNQVNRRLTRSKDKDTRSAAERRLQQGQEMRREQIQLREDAGQVRSNIAEDQHDAAYRVQEYAISRQSLRDDISAVGTRAASEAASETAANFTEPPEPEPAEYTGPGSGKSAAELRESALSTELALAQAGYGLNGQLGTQRSLEAIMNDLVAANESRITEARTLLRDNDTSNDQTAYQAITDAANAIKGLRDDLNELPNSANQIAIQGGVLSTAMRDLYRSFGGNFSLAQSGLSGGQQAATRMAAPYAVGPGLSVPQQSTGGGNTIYIEQNFPTQPDPRTWAAATRFELNASM